MPGSQVINHNSRVPICPDVQLRDLPFYDIQAQLTRPTSLRKVPKNPRMISMLNINAGDDVNSYAIYALCL